MPITDAVAILHRRYYAGNPARQAALDRTRRALDRLLARYAARKERQNAQETTTDETEATQKCRQRS